MNHRPTWQIRLDISNATEIIADTRGRPEFAADFVKWVERRNELESELEAARAAMRQHLLQIIGRDA